MFRRGPRGRRRLRSATEQVGQLVHPRLDPPASDMPVTFASDKGRFVIDGGAVLRTAPTTRAPFHQEHVRGALQTSRAARATSHHHGRERSTSSLRALSSEPVRAGPRSFRSCTTIAVALFGRNETMEPMRRRSTASCYSGTWPRARSTYTSGAELLSSTRDGARRFDPCASLSRGRARE